MPRVLIVDDNNNLLRVFQIAIRRAGYEVEIANNARVGLQLVEQNKFDLILADQRMPDMEGTDFIREACKRHHKGKVALITATENQAVAHSGCPYLIKPFTMGQLVDFVDGFFQQAS